MKKLGSFLLILALTAGTLAGCGGSGGDSSDAAKKDTLTVVINSDPGTLDPHDNVNFAPHQVKRQISETLVVRNDEGELVPWLAESWEYEDDETLVFQIRQGVKFHNGEELKASDVLFSLKRALDDNTTGAIQVNRIDFNRCEVMGDYTVKIVTDGPYAMQLAMLENPLISMISEKAYTESGGDFFEAPIGTGPYKLTKVVTDEYAVFEANETYWGEQPKIKRVVVKVIPDNQTRILALEKGEIDLIWGKNMLDADALNKYKDSKGFGVALSAPTSTRHIVLNGQNPVLADIHVRKALQHATNRVAIAKGVFHNTELPADTLYARSVPYCDIDLKPYEYDMAKAARILDEAGWKPGSDGIRQKDGKRMELGLLYNSNSVTEKTIAEYLQHEYGKLGITYRLKGVPPMDSAKLMELQKLIHKPAEAVTRMSL